MFAMCAAIGVPDAATYVFTMLHLLQHRVRGRKYCRIDAIGSDGLVRSATGEGIVLKIFTQESMRKLSGNIAVGIGGTNGVSVSLAASSARRMGQQPGVLAIGGECDLYTRRGLIRRHEPLEQATWLLNELSHAPDAGPPLHRQLASFVGSNPGKYSVILAESDRLTISRDPEGLIPAAYARPPRDKHSADRQFPATLFATETAALEGIGARYITELEPGCLLRVSSQGRSVKSFSRSAPSLCSYGQIYMLHPASVLHGQTAADMRIKLGCRAAEFLCSSLPRLDNPVVVGVPDSGIHLAEGVSDGLVVPIKHGILRNHYLSSSLPHEYRIKYSVITHVIAGKDVILVDDLVIEGRVSQYLVGQLKSRGARSVHLVAGPAMFRACPDKIGLHGKHDFLAAQTSQAAMCRQIGADSLHLIPVEIFRGLLGPDYCFRCMDSN